MAHRFRELIIWQRAMRFTGDIYRFGQSFPHSEQYGLTSQIRRAATSIALNIAEGSGASSAKEFALFLSYSLRSTYETMTALEIARMLQYGETGRVDMLLAEADQLAAMISTFAKKIKSHENNSSIREIEALYDINTHDQSIDELPSDTLTL